MAADTPAYGGGSGLWREDVTRIAAGHTANSQRWSFPSHLGTHLDAPRHFFDGAATIDAAPPEFWWFVHPALVDVAIEADGLIGPEHVAAQVPIDCDLLLIRTGFEAQRGDPAYWEHNPGLTEALGRWCRTERPSLRAVGMDLISATPQANKAVGRAAHRAFLEPSRNGQPILLIEDMALAHAPKAFHAVCVAPLRVLNGDGGPCTVLAWAVD